ncbi:STAS domain-containing protein [Candidatus Kryptobacter tengchongensis]|uniref:STAS domain-containing protein n=1 Tax=Kryptobacter tengchongensis TaxID=1643429 RepID=UPI00092E23EE|nr:STAS domain-containing protein [Candidatus Kryptobacter tengchongensis]
MKEKNFDLKIEERGEVKILKMKGYLDAYTSLQFEEKMKELVESGNYKIVVNMKNLSYISSAGFGVFMAFVDEVRKNGGDIKFCCLPEKIDEIFELLGFKHIFEVLNDENKAIESFEKLGVKNAKKRKK